MSTPIMSGGLWQPAGGLVLPKFETPVPPEAIEAGDGQHVLDFAAAYGRIHKDSIGGKVGQPIHWLPWQVRVIRRVYARDPETGRRLHRRYMLAVARKNGKTAMLAVLALYGLLMEAEGAEVYSCAAEREQAKLVFTAARRMVEMDPELREVIRIYRDVLEFKATGSIYKALSAEAFTKEGLSPSMVAFDELHALPDRDLYDVMSLAMGARVDPLMVIVTTAGVMLDRFGQPTVCNQLYNYGRKVAAGEIEDPTFGMSWYQPDDVEADFRDHKARLQANPSLGVVLDPADLDSAMPPATPENEYRTKRLNCWVTGSQSWLPFGAWKAVADPDRKVSPKEQVVLAFDGSWTNDSTALIGCTVEGKHIFKVAAWERPPEAQAWVVPEDEVRAQVAKALGDYNVVELVCDPSYWRKQIVGWEEELDAPVVEFPPHMVGLMTPATREFYTAVIQKKLTHDGDPGLARHIDNAVIKEDMRGARIVKQAKGLKIDMAVAAVMAHSRALTFDEGVGVEFIPL
jgi:phage terminase large subunit-like protein